VSFDTYEGSIDSGSPLELYHFWRGLEDYYYTTAEESVVFGGHTYVPRQITRNSPDQSTEEGRGKLELVLLSDDAVCSRYVNIPPPDDLYVQVTKFHRADLLDGRVLWTGRIVSVSFVEGGGKCKMMAVPSESMASRQIPNYTYQGLCNNFLFDANCQVVAASFLYTGVISTVSTDQVTVSGLTAAKGAGWAVGGKIVVGTDARLVRAQTGDVLTLSAPFPSSPSGQSVDVYAGCDHTLATCNSKFANALNYGGFAFVPTKNPFQTGVG
jgi:uncharacterized phage protein (TIGR02218 family)